MREYCAYFSGWIETTKEEILALKTDFYIDQKSYTSNLKILNDFYNGKNKREKLNIVDYTIRHVPEKANKYDVAVMICVKLDDDTYLAKRHINNQHINLYY